MSVRYNKDFKLEVVRAYMAGDKSIFLHSIPKYVALS